MSNKTNLWDKLIQDVEGLNKESGNVVYLLIMDDIMIASTRKSDINEHLASYKRLVPEFTSTKPAARHITTGDIQLIHGIVLDPLELPMELPESFKSYDMWLIRSDKYIKLLGAIEYEIFDSIKEIADEIETILNQDGSASIEDFAIIVGDELDLIIQVDTDMPSINNAKEVI